MKSCARPVAQLLRKCVKIEDALPRAQDITVCLIGFEQHKARPDLSEKSGFWLLVKAADALPFVSAFKVSPAVFHEFLIEQRVGKEIRSSSLSAQIVKIDEGPSET
jgi:hypothetical protein